jgi:hypothetical protein
MAYSQIVKTGNINEAMQVALYIFGRYLYETRYRCM